MLCALANFTCQNNNWKCARFVPYMNAAVYIQICQQSENCCHGFTGKKVKIPFPQGAEEYNHLPRVFSTRTECFEHYLHVCDEKNALGSALTSKMARTGWDTHACTVQSALKGARLSSRDLFDLLRADWTTPHKSMCGYSCFVHSRFCLPKQL